MPIVDILVAHALLGDLPVDPDSDLSVSELRRADQFKLASRREEFMAGRFLLRKLLEHHTGQDRASHEIITTEKGKPVCVGGPGISISHSEQHVFCALVGDGEIGIDVEVPPQPRDAGKIASRFFSEQEAAWVARDPDERFLMLWVIKEAWLKATGLGLSGGLDSLECAILPPKITARLTDNVPAYLSVFRQGATFVGLATTTAMHRSVKALRWSSRANRLVAGAKLQSVAST